MNPGTRPASIQPPGVADEGIKSWLDALASGICDAPAFVRAMQNRVGADPADGTWEVLSQLDQYYRRGRIETETFKEIKTALAVSVFGLGTASAGPDNPAMRAAPARKTPVAREVPAAREVPVPREAPAARDIDAAVRLEQTDAHPRREDTQSSDSIGEPKAGSVLRHRYRIEAVVGQGRKGTVFQVLDEFRLEAPGNQRLAIKILHPTVVKRAELLAEVRREFQSLQSLSHPNIIRVFDFDRDGALVFFTMELLTGAPLSRIVEARKLIPLERAQALGVIRDIGAALSYAHTRGAVHGELNPQNVFITGSDGLRVMGFGDSHKTRQISLEPDLEMTLPFSKSTFASCQVLEGARADARDDVFSLGCIAYLLLSGAHPFPNSTAIEARAVKLRPRRPANLSGRQWQALRNALRWDRESRPADMQKWLSQLDLGAAKKLAPLHDLLQPPAAKESKFGLALGLVAGLSAALFAVYWLVNHRDMLASIDSTAPIRAPANPATPVATPPVAAAPAISAPSIDRANAPSGAVVPPRLAAMSVPASHPSAIAAPVAPAPAKTPAGTSKVELVADTVDVPARQPSAQVTVHRKGNLRGETSFTWWTESGTAKQGVDFSTVVPQLGYLADGKSDVSLSIPLSIAPHARAKSFYVVIDQSEGGASLGARTLTMVTLQPSD